MPGVPAARITAAADAGLAHARVVATGGFRNCIVSAMAKRPIMSPPGELM